MSTYWGYVCLSHDPELESERWFNHGEETLTTVFRQERAGEWPDQPVIVGVNDALGPEAAYVVHHSRATNDPVYWLRGHPRCAIAIRSEYGDTHRLWDREACPRCGVLTATHYTEAGQCTGCGWRETPGPENAWPTPEEWVDWFLSLARAGQVDAAGRALTAGQEAVRCFEQGHVPRLQALEGRLRDQGYPL